MAGICSKHQLYALECNHCNAVVSDKETTPHWVIRNHFEYYVKLIGMIQAQAESINKTHNTTETYALVQNLKNLENTFTGRYD